MRLMCGSNSIDAEMFLVVQTSVDAKGIAGRLALAGGDAEQSRDEVGLARWVAKGRVAKQIAPVQERGELGEAARVVGEIAFPSGPDDGERETVYGEEDDEGNEGGHVGDHAHLEVGGKVDGPEDAAAEDGQGQGEERDERDPRDLPVTGGCSLDRDQAERAAGIVQEQALLGQGAARLGERGERLERAEGQVQVPPEQEQHHADQGRHKAVEEARR